MPRRTPAIRPNRRLPRRRGPLDNAEREVLAVLRGRGLSTTAIAVHLGRAYGPVRVAVAAYDREHRHD